MNTLAAVITGLVAAASVYLSWSVPSHFSGINWVSPAFLLGVTALAVLFQQFVIERRAGQRAYNGLADLFVHIHSGSRADSSLAWGLRGILSFLFAICGGVVGAEGAAIEFSHALLIQSRSRTSRWFEQRRRTDAAMALAAGVSAAFRAPFAGLLLPMELGTGGRALSSVTASLTAYLATRYLVALGGPGVSGFELGAALPELSSFGFREALGVLVVSVLAGVLGVILIRFIRYSEESLVDLFQTRVWMRVLIAGVLLFLLSWVTHGMHLRGSSLLDQVLWARFAPKEVGLLFATRLLALSLVLAGFGTAGILWPLFIIGGLFGYCTDAWILRGFAGFSTTAALMGGAGVWGTVLGAPFSGAVVAFEMTGSVSVLLPCLIAGLIGQKIRKTLRTAPLIEKHLQARGISLIEGRSASVLDSVSVSEAMVTDFEAAHERETVAELHARLLNSRYPFIAVVGGQGQYLGLLTIDLIQDAHQRAHGGAQERASSNSPLSTLLEAKDLLYRSRLKAPTVKTNDRLSVTAGLFEQLPCIPVLADDGRILGLLFAYNVRLAYDREVARRSLAHQYGKPIS